MSAAKAAASTVTQDYLKVIWTAREWDAEEPVTTTMLAARMGVSASTASEAIKRLADQGLVRHAPYRSIELTETGRRLALAMVRRHRLLETFLVVKMGYGWDEAHDDAEILEHAASNQFIDRVDEILGHPAADPHGDPIPSGDGTVARPAAVPLSTVPAPCRAQVVRISDADPAMLRYFATVGLVPEAQVTVVERRDYAGVIGLRVAGSDDVVSLGGVAAEAVWVAPEQA
ncbi:MAG: metal-dependent transcriptional regulator [Bifidobacteriaceae bacterium]|nr:metal-dependent transcriptional regulator [Bifidobacteriaceae bacterium]